MMYSASEAARMEDFFDYFFDISFRVMYFVLICTWLDATPPSIFFFSAKEDEWS